MNLRTIVLEVLTILSSFSTLLCCAMPALLVSIGARRRYHRSATTRLAFRAQNFAFRICRSHADAIGRVLSQSQRAVPD